MTEPEGSPPTMAYVRAGVENIDDVRPACHPFGAQRYVVLELPGLRLSFNDFATPVEVAAALRRLAERVEALGGAS